MGLRRGQGGCRAQPEAREPPNRGALLVPTRRAGRPAPNWGRGQREEAPPDSGRIVPTKESICLELAQAPRKRDTCKLRATEGGNCRQVDKNVSFYLISSPGQSPLPPRPCWALPAAQSPGKALERSAKTGGRLGPEHQFKCSLGRVGVGGPERRGENF